MSVKFKIQGIDKESVVNKASWFLLCSIGVTLITASGYAQEQKVGIGDFGFSFAPKILKEGSITDLGFSLKYTERLSGAIHFRYTAIAKNEELFGVADSLNAVNNHIFETFFLPIQYGLLATEKYTLYLGGGAYYEYDALTEKGFFNMPALEQLGKERVNAYTNDFSMHVFGPLIEGSFTYAVARFALTLTGGIVPVFLLGSSQKVGIVPLLDPGYADYAQTTGGSPYFYVHLDCALLKYFNVAVLYDFVHLSYKTINFDEQLACYTPEQETRSQFLKIEASALLPLGGGMSFQIGYGYTFDWTQFDDTSPFMSNRQYMILTVKKTRN
ncbi:MAG: hypothetical protein LBD58_04590 [Treponema sp.]|nr:hypothetical protein [Treponema sp.]